VLTSFGSALVAEKKKGKYDYYDPCPEWRANLRNFFLLPPAEMLSFLQQLREAL
jgi:hypothetical protein